MSTSTVTTGYPATTSYYGATSYPGNGALYSSSSSTRYLNGGLQSYTAATPSYAASYVARPAETFVEPLPVTYALTRSEPLPSRVAVGDGSIAYTDASLVNVNRVSAGPGSPSTRIVKGTGYVADNRARSWAGPAPAYAGAYAGAGYSSGVYAVGGGYAAPAGGYYAGGTGSYAGSRIASYERPGGSFRSVAGGPADAYGSYTVNY